MPIPKRGLASFQGSPTPTPSPLVAVGVLPGVRPGTGYLSGEAPSGLTTLAGDPVICEIHVHQRKKNSAHGDGHLIAVTNSNAAGEWLVTGLNPAERFDVIARLPGYRDVICSDVAPYVAPSTQNVYPEAQHEPLFDSRRFGHCAVG